MDRQLHSVANVSFLPCVVAGHPIVLSEHIAKLGFEVRIWQLESHVFGYGIDSPIFRPDDGIFLQELKRLRVLFQVLLWSDVIHCTFGSTIARNTSYKRTNRKWVFGFLTNCFIQIANIYQDLFLIIELTLYKLTRKKLVIDFQGDDIRQRDFQIENYQHSIAHVVNPDYYTPESDRLKRKRLRLFEKFGFQLNALNPDLLNYLPSKAKFVPYSNVRLEGKTLKKTLAVDQVFVFVHAPSNRTVKGTVKIIEAIKQLKLEGEPVELKLVEGLKNIEALEQYGQAFMAIDQLNAGWYGGFAVECMAKGVPVISYIREKDLDFLPKKMRAELPIRSACSCNIRNVILNSIRISRIDYEKLSQESIDFVYRWHNPELIATNVVKNYF